MSAAQTLSAASRPGSRLRRLLDLAWPVVLARLGIMAMGVTDAVVVGHHGARELAYQALGWAPTTIVLGASIGLLQGVQVLTAHHVGEGRSEAVGAVLRRGLSYGLWVGLASVAILLVLGPPFLHAIGLEPGLADGSSAVLRVFACSLPGYFLATACTYFLEALGRPKVGMTAMWTANLVNLAINLWLVPGHSGLPVSGAMASAVSTFIARNALAVVLLVYIFNMADARRLGLFERPAGGLAAAVQRKIGYGAGASMLIEIGAFSAMTLIAGRIGGLEAAAWASVLNVAAIVFMGPLGLSTATAVMVGHAHGAGAPREVLRAGLTGLGVTAVLMALVCLVVGLGAALIAHGYSSDPQLIALIAPALVLSCLFYLPDGLQVVAAQALRARGDVWAPTACHVISYAVLMIPLGAWFAAGLGLGVSGLVWAVVVASLVSGVLLVGRFLWLSRRELLRRTA